MARFDGTIPEAIANLQTLTILELYGNVSMGTIPEVGGNAGEAQRGPCI